MQIKAEQILLSIRKEIVNQEEHERKQGFSSDSCYLKTLREVNTSLTSGESVTILPYRG